ncbi:MAG: hypothetical protein GY776_00980 [Alteromonas sp.]|nr:hypothetical protein [Alteromonas sp.]
MNIHAYPVFDDSGKRTHFELWKSGEKAWGFRFKTVNAIFAFTGQQEIHIHDEAKNEHTK